jgi:enterochelin esterase-like enzyme
MEVVMRKRRKCITLLLVFVMLLTSIGKVPVEAQAAKLKTVTVGTQKELEAALQDAKVGKIIISTESNVTLTIPKGAGSSSMSLVVNAANATVVNNGSFKETTIEASKKFTENGKVDKIVIKGKKVDFVASSKAEIKTLTCSGANSKLTFKKGATLEKLSIKGSSANVTVAKGATVGVVSVDKKGASLNLVADGKVAVDIVAKAKVTISGTAKNTIVNIRKKAEGTTLTASSSIKLDTKATIDVTLKKGAEGSALKVTDENANIAVKNKTNKTIKVETSKGIISIGKGEELKKDTTETTPAPTAKPTQTPVPTTAPSTGGGSDSSGGFPSSPSPFDAKGRLIANFGTPKIDGTVDNIWNNAVPVTVKDSNGKTDTTADFRVLWDDYAIYVLANVKDSALDSASGSVYEKDSVEIFLDEKNDKTKDYGVDDLHFRVNYKNEQSADNGDLSRFYTYAKAVDGGYIVEARVALSEKLAANGKVYGFELQINDAKGGRRITTLQLFDQTGMAYADTGLFGELVLKGRAANSTSGLNPYDLMNLVRNSKEILLDRYTNGDVVKGLIAEAEALIMDENTTQKKIDELYAKLDHAVENLIHDNKDYDDKECRLVPIKYKTVDEHQGTIERVTYNTNSYDSKNEARVKDFLVYLPYGYNSNDKAEKYNVLYLIHGMGENQDTVFGGPGQNTELMKILDNMIYNGDLEPLIVVTPTWSYQGNSGDFSVIFTQTENFHNELVKDIIPKVESMYNTYATSTSEQDLIAAREHRALAGFSMGSSTTWNTFINRVEYFKYYMPISAATMWSTGLDEFAGTMDEKRAQFLESVVKEAGYGPNDVSIFCATGTEDMAYGGMVTQVEAMKKLNDTFLYTANLNKGNFYFMALEGGTHIWNCVNRYLYNMLPDLFNNKSIALETPAPIPVDTNGFDTNGRMVAKFGAPTIDGTVDQAWENAVPVTVRDAAGKTDTTAEIRVLWDDKALYLLAKVKDSQLDASAVNVYDRDSVEIFLDENHDRTVNYGTDDLHFRVGHDNKQSADNGDLRRFYTKTAVVDGGYIVEARVSLVNKPVNDTVLGIDFSVNDGRGGSKIAQLTVFDKNNEAYKDTSKFGAILLTGRAQGAVSGLNPYDLINAIEEGKEIKLERYSNGAAVQGLITEAEAALTKADVTQKEMNKLYKSLRTAIDGLIPNGNSYEDKEIRMIPLKYKTVDEHQGTIERVAYTTVTDGEELTKDMLVYLPAGYDQTDKNKKYNVLYLIHGLSENQNTVFGGPGENTELMKIVDNMIYNGQLEPMIIVTPTWAHKGDSDFMQAFFYGRPAKFHQELVNDIIPAIEGKYNVYAETTGATDLIAARDHRAVAGFSMGSSATWYTYINQIKYFKYYMPISLSCQVGAADLTKYEGTLAEKRAQYLESIAEAAGYGPNDFSIFCATGTEDSLAYNDMNPQMEAMKNLKPTFMYSADLTKGNFYYLLLEGGTHIWNCVNRYLYNMLPDLFNDKSIDPSLIPAKEEVSFDFNDGTGKKITKRVNANGAVKLPTTEVTMPGAELVGWSTTPEAADMVTPEADGTYKAAKNATLYAIWQWSKPSVVASGSAITVDVNSPRLIKLAVAVTGAAITVDASNEIIANPGESFIMSITKSVSSTVTDNYVIQYALVDSAATEDALTGAEWKDISFGGDDAIVTVDAGTASRKIYIRVASKATWKFLNGSAVLLEAKN